MPDRKQHELRCFCRRHPLLAVYGVDAKGRVFVHIKVYKQRRVFGESVHYGGEVKIRCRECFRWNNIIFISSNPERAVLEETVQPAEVDSGGTMMPAASKDGT